MSAFVHRDPHPRHRSLMLVESIAEIGNEIVPVDRSWRSRMAIGRDHEVLSHPQPPEGPLHKSFSKQLASIEAFLNNVELFSNLIRQSFKQWADLQR